MKMMYRILVTCGFVLLYVLQGGSQDIHYSQFYMAPLHLNPAMAGVMNSNHRVIANYRNQWGSILTRPFNTFSASYDQKVPVGRSDYFGWGASGWGDIAGETRHKQIMGRLTGSFSKMLMGGKSQSHYLVAGADIGVNRRSLDVSGLRFGSQFDPGTGTFDPTLPTDPFLADITPITFFDVSGGLMWFSVFGKRTNFYTGLALAHINTPNVSMIGGDTPLARRLTVHGGGEVPVGQVVSLAPGFVVFSQGSSFEANFGNSFRFDLETGETFSQSLDLGIWLRLVNNYVGENSKNMGPESVILSARFNFDQFGIGFSYDWNISKLQAATRGNGAFELSVNYLIFGSEKRGLYCPVF